MEIEDEVAKMLGKPVKKLKVKCTECDTVLIGMNKINDHKEKNNTHYTYICFNSKLKLCVG